MVRPPYNRITPKSDGKRPIKKKPGKSQATSPNGALATTKIRWELGSTSSKCLLDLIGEHGWTWVKLFLNPGKGQAIILELERILKYKMMDFGLPLQDFVPSRGQHHWTESTAQSVLPCGCRRRVLSLALDSADHRRLQVSVFIPMMNIDCLCLSVLGLSFSMSFRMNSLHDS